jgi:hypothetical protein
MARSFRVMNRIPAELSTGPFTLDEARAAGISARSLQGRRWKRLGNGVYCRSDQDVDPWLLLAVWQRSLGGNVIFGGRTAAWLHGLTRDVPFPTHVVVSPASPARSCNGLDVRHCDIPSDELSARRSLAFTSIGRTLRDLCVAEEAVEALVFIDAALACGTADLESLNRYVHESAGLPGTARMRRLVGWAEPVASPMETRLRWLCVGAGLGRPRVQEELRDSDGSLIGLADIYYPEARLVIEFDGGIHRVHMVKDDRRQNQLVNAGYSVLRFTSADLYYRPTAVVAEVRAVLENAGALSRSVQTAPKTVRLPERFGGMRPNPGLFRR